MASKKQRQMLPAQVLVLGFALIILMGAIILMLPVSNAAGQVTDPLTALFTATTSVCVTGLVVVPTYSHWSFFGQCVILLLIQTGGLGFMTFATMTVVALGRKISLKDRLLIQESLNQNSMSGLIRLTQKVVLGTILVEGCGAVLLCFRFIPEFGFAKGLYYGIFHSVSAFCNAGLDVIGPDSMVPYVSDPFVNLVLILLIVLGGLGYIVWLDVLGAVRRCKAGKHKLRYSFWVSVWKECTLYSRLVLMMTGILIISGALLFWLMEIRNPQTLGGLSFPGSVQAAVFQSVTTRTAGFASIDQGAMMDNSKILSSILMFIGGSSGSTAGGIKTVTAAVLILTIWSYIRGRSDTEIFGRRISASAVRRAVSLFACAFLGILMVSMLISGMDKMPFLDVLFEVASAAGTTGLSTGITAALSPVSQVLVIMLMFVGRLGPLTVMMALTIRQKESRANVRKPEEEVLIG